MALKPGDTLLSGHYRILRLLGRGGFGFVYLARDTLLDRDVAMKELIPGLVGDEAMLKRFLVEARATMELTHKRIVRTYNIFSEGGNYYIVMEYMPDGSLEERLREHGSLSVDEAVQVAAEVCEGLACAHEEKVVHCDLKPANILFDAQGQAKVADFGIAHVSREMFSRPWRTRTGSFMGTLQYMSPEQTEGVRDDPRVDVYALGAVLYRMLTGYTYLGFDPRETPRSQFDNMQRILEEEPQPPSTHKQEIPPWLDGVVLQALAKRPEDRYADAGAMAVALQQVGPVPGATPAPPAPRARARGEPSVKKRTPLPGWFWVVAGAAGVLLLVLVTVLVMWPGGGDGQETAIAEATTAPALPPSYTPTPTDTPTGTNTPSPTATATDTPRPTATSTPRPTDTPPPPTATETAEPTATLAPTPTDTPLPPTATPAPPTNTPVPSASNWSWNAWLVGVGQDNQTCESGNLQVRVMVRDANGNQIPGVWIHDFYSKQYHMTGNVDALDYGPGETKFEYGINGGGKVCVANGEGGGCVTDYSRDMPCYNAPPFEDLWAAGYCECCEVGISKERCQQLYNTGVLCMKQPRHYSWRIEYTRSW